MPELTVSGWTQEEWAEIMRAAHQRGMSVEKYLIAVVRERLTDMPDVMEPIFHQHQQQRAAK